MIKRFLIICLRIILSYPFTYYFCSQFCLTYFVFAEANPNVSVGVVVAQYFVAFHREEPLLSGEDNAEVKGHVDAQTPRQATITLEPFAIEFPDLKIIYFSETVRILYDNDDGVDK